MVDTRRQTGVAAVDIGAGQPFDVQTERLLQRDPGMRLLHLGVR